MDHPESGGAQQAVPFTTLFSGVLLINVFYWMGADRMLRALVIPRRTHRPHHYFLEEPEKVVVAPGAIDMTGLMITPRAVDFEKLDADTVRRIYNEVAFSDALPESVKKHFGL